MSALRQRRDVLLVLLGLAGLLSKKWFFDSAGELVHSYLGNLAASFAVYFIVSLGSGQRLSRATIGLIALLVVETFEMADGFEIMANVYDPFDLLANALGIALAYCADMASSRVAPLDSGGH